MVEVVVVDHHEGDIVVGAGRIQVGGVAGIKAVGGGGGQPQQHQSGGNPGEHPGLVWEVPHQSRHQKHPQHHQGEHGHKIAQGLEGGELHRHQEKAQSGQAGEEEVEPLGAWAAAEGHHGQGRHPHGYHHKEGQGQGEGPGQVAQILHQMVPVSALGQVGDTPVAVEQVVQAGWEQVDAHRPIQAVGQGKAQPGAPPFLPEHSPQGDQEEERGIDGKEVLGEKAQHTDEAEAQPPPHVPGKAAVVELHAGVHIQQHKEGQQHVHPLKEHHGQGAHAQPVEEEGRHPKPLQPHAAQEGEQHQAAGQQGREVNEKDGVLGKLAP